MNRVIFYKVNYMHYLPEFQLCTQITIDEKTGIKEVIKSPFTAESRQHLARMEEAGELLQNFFPHLNVCPCKSESDGLHFPFIKGHSRLEMLLASTLEDESEYLSAWTDFFALLDPKSEFCCKFKSSPEFEDLFGNGTAFEGDDAYPFCSIDLTPANVIDSEDGNSIFIDYEFFLKKPIPIALVKYFVLTTMYLNFKKFAEKIPVERLLELCNLRHPVKYYEIAIKHFRERIFVEGGV